MLKSRSLIRLSWDAEGQSVPQFVDFSSNLSTFWNNPWVNLSLSRRELTRVTRPIALHTILSKIQDFGSIFRGVYPTSNSPQSHFVPLVLLHICEKLSLSRQIGW